MDPVVATVNSIQLAYSRESGDARAYANAISRMSTHQNADLRWKRGALTPVCVENLIRVDAATKSAKLEK
jgi:hypothetical protein